MILTSDIISFKRTTYGRAGDQVKMISMHGCVLIVENERGDRFPVNSEEVSEKSQKEENRNYLAAITLVPADAKGVKKQSVPSKTIPENPAEKIGQQSLF